ncbi:HAD-IB family phosphatase [Candidatus Peregrinibacteria bacterium]|nr:HAD-IB family phosphatase [Candidatus Peregrinibacteria bacterium]
MKQNSTQVIGKQIENLLKILKVNKHVKGEAAVFFDIDGTVSRNDNLELLINEITNRNLLPQEKEAIVEKSRELWKSRDLDFKDYMTTVIDMLPNLKFFSRDILEKISKDVIAGPGSHFYLLPWMLLIRLKNLGYKLIAISGAPSFMAKEYLEKIGLFPWKIHSSEWIFENNVFSGKIDLNILNDKGDFIENTYKNVFDLKRCIALGDTISDVPMLQKVGQAIAINPTYALAQKAREEKWTIVLERKDLIVSFPHGQLQI